MKRDLTRAQFLHRLEKEGMEPEGFMGYVHIGGGVRVSVWNAGNRRRDQLKYLLLARLNTLAEKFERGLRGEA